MLLRSAVMPRKSPFQRPTAHRKTLYDRMKNRNKSSGYQKSNPSANPYGRAFVASK